MRKSILEGTAAGVFIGIGGSVFLALKNDNKIMGAILFTVALLSICLLSLQLFTGKVGMIVTSHKKADWVSLLGCFIGNTLGTFLCAVMIWIGRPALVEEAVSLIEKKLPMTIPQVFFTGVLCGILMYTAVYLYKSQGKIAAILFCVPVFILAGFEHSIADMFYFFAAKSFTLSSLVFLVMVVLGNSAGGMLIPFLVKLGNPEKK